jgi:hypothetical protein
VTFFCAAADTNAVKALDWSVPQACREAAGCPFDVVGELQQNDPLFCVGIGAVERVPEAGAAPVVGATAGVPVVPLVELDVIAAPLLAGVVALCGVVLEVVAAPVGTGWQNEPLASGSSSTRLPGGQLCLPPLVAAALLLLGSVCLPLLVAVGLWLLELETYGFFGWSSSSWDR